MTLLDVVPPATRAAAFPLPASAFEVRTAMGPMGFFDLLRELFSTARHRLSLASLYYGTGDREAVLLDDVKGALARSPDLRVRMLFDHSRGHRRTKTGSSATFIAERLLPHERVELFLHRLPQLGGLATLLPSPLNELLALSHFKVLVADDTAVLTGANLSDEYFHCRHARVIVVRDRQFADMMSGIVTIASEHSRRVREGGAAEDLPARDPRELGARVAQHVAAAPRPSSGEAHVVPFFQHPGVGLHQERELLRALFAVPDGAMCIHTPYTNLPRDYLAALGARLAARPSGGTKFVLASRHSHSFTTGRGLKALVPGFYVEREHHCRTRLLAAAKGGGAVEMEHYRRPGWVFHSKGVWLRTAGETATLIGSSSYGARSVARDLELSCLVVTADPALREAIGGELATTGPYTEPAAATTRPLTSWVTSPFVRSFM